MILICQNTFTIIEFSFLRALCEPRVWSFDPTQHTVCVKPYRCAAFFSPVSCCIWFIDPFQQRDYIARSISRDMTDVDMDMSAIVCAMRRRPYRHTHTHEYKVQRIYMFETHGMHLHQQTCWHREEWSELILNS